MNCRDLIPIWRHVCFDSDPIINPVENYYENRDLLLETNLKAALSLGEEALLFAKKIKQLNDIVGIYDDLAFAASELGDCNLGLSYLMESRQYLSETKNPIDMLNSIILESSIYCKMARSLEGSHDQQKIFEKSIQTSLKGFKFYFEHDLDNQDLLGQLYLCLAEAQSSNPNGNLIKSKHCFIQAENCFIKVNNVESAVYAQLGIGKIHLLLGEYQQCKDIIYQTRSKCASEDILLSIDHLEGMLEFARKNFDESYDCARTGLVRAQTLNYKQEESEFLELLNQLEMERLKSEDKTCTFSWIKI